MPDTSTPHDPTAAQAVGRRSAVCEVVLDQSPPEPVLRLVRDRFGEPSCDDGTRLLLAGLDQAALRALLTLLWDAGLSVRYVRWLG